MLRAEPAHRLDRRDAVPGRWRLAVATVAVLLAAADTYVVVLALPDIMAGVGLTTAELQRASPIITAFLLGYVALLPPVGRLSDIHGRVPTLAGCLSVFALGSVFTAGAHGLALVVTGRFLQGLGGGGLVPVTLALVADLWPAGRRALPLGAVSGVQELGSLVGPLYGAAIVAWSGWRAIFWINAAAGVLLGLLLLAKAPAEGRDGAAPRAVADGTGTVLLGLTLAGIVLLLASPSALTSSVRFGEIYLPLVAGVAVSEPLVLATAVAGVLFVVRECTARRPLLRLRRLPGLAREADAPGAALLAGALACVIVTFATADPRTQVMAAAGPWLLGVAALFGIGFAVRESRTSEPLVDFRGLSDRAAVGALVVSFALGAALMAALVDIPIFARTTAFPDSQLQAALVLVRFLVGVPVGALLGGAVCERLSYRLTAAAGMALACAMFAVMAGWPAHALARHGPGASDVVLVAGGLGFGLAIAPVNAAALRAVAARLHGTTSALVVVARMVGMLVGLSVLTAVGLHQFYAAQRHIPSPTVSCPADPAHCRVYDDAVTAAALRELHVIFGGAAVAAGLASVAAGAFLRRAALRPDDAPDPSGGETTCAPSAT